MTNLFSLHPQNTAHSTLSIVLFLIFFFSLTSCETFNSQLATSAAMDAVQALTLSDQQIQSLSEQSVQSIDESHNIAPPNNPYAKRLQRLVDTYPPTHHRHFDFKVYLKDELNAFALANGSIRFYSGLMDTLNDEELLFVIGHEVGHIIEGHSKKAAQISYSTSAARKGVAAIGGTTGQIASSAIGEISQQIITAQFSQRDEMSADDYGFAFLQHHHLPKSASVTALRKLGNQGGGFLSSHPNPQDRADRLSTRF